MSFKIGQRVLISSGPYCLFNRRCVIIDSAEHWASRIRHPDGRTQVINQRFMKPAPNDATELHDLLDYRESDHGPTNDYY